jgi:sec-independent protein translocase protein TatA
MFDDLFQPSHLLLILWVILLLFGPKRLPELGRALGQAIRGFREATSKSLTPPAPEESPTDHKSKSAG